MQGAPASNSTFRSNSSDASVADTVTPQQALDARFGSFSVSSSHASGGAVRRFVRRRTSGTSNASAENTGAPVPHAEVLHAPVSNASHPIATQSVSPSSTNTNVGPSTASHSHTAAAQQALSTTAAVQDGNATPAASEAAPTGSLNVSASPSSAFASSRSTPQPAASATAASATAASATAASSSANASPASAQNAHSSSSSPNAAPSSPSVGSTASSQQASSTTGVPGSTASNLSGTASTPVGTPAAAHQSTETPSHTAGNSAASDPSAGAGCATAPAGTSRARGSSASSSSPQPSASHSRAGAGAGASTSNNAPASSGSRPASGSAHPSTAPRASTFSHQPGRTPDQGLPASNGPSDSWRWPTPGPVIESFFIQLLPGAAPRLKSLSTATAAKIVMDRQRGGVFRLAAQQYQDAKWLFSMQPVDHSAAGVNHSPEYKSWHADLTKIMQSPWLQDALNHSVGMPSIVEHVSQFVLLQPQHFAELWPTDLQGSNSSLKTMRRQKIATAAARIGLHQRKRLVFEGYKARFAKVGVITEGDLDYLEEADLLELRLPRAAKDVMLTCIQRGMCRPPIALECHAAIQGLQRPIEGLLGDFGLSSTASLFHDQHMHTIEDAMTLSESDLLQWQNLFTIQLPFRKLKKLMLSLPLNVWYKQLRVDGLLPAGCLGVRDLLLYDIDEHWKSIHSTWSLQTSMHGFSSFSYARLQHTIAMFKQVASSFVVGIDQQARLQDVWLRYGYVLEQGFGLQSADDLLDLHKGDLDELMGEPNLFSTAVFHYLHHVAETHELPVRCSGPDLEYQEALPESCLGKLLDWLMHPDVNLAGYYPFFTRAGVQHLQDLSNLNLDQVQPYMLPWDARRLVACISTLLCKDRAYGVLEPSLFCSPGSNVLTFWPAGAKWLACSFFGHFAEALAQPDISVTIPADAVFLTKADIEKLDFGHHVWASAAWKQSLQTTLEQIRLEDYFEICKQRFPRALASVGVYKPGDMHWLDATALQSLTGRVSHQICKWLSAAMEDTPSHQWQRFERDISQSPEAELLRWQRHAELLMQVPACLGVRSVADLQGVSPEVQLTSVRPVQQNRLRWALRSYQNQLAEDARQREAEQAENADNGRHRPGGNESDAQQGGSAAADAESRQPNAREQAEARHAAQEAARPEAASKVAEAYQKHGDTDDVRAFFSELHHLHPKLDPAQLSGQPVHRTGQWKQQMLHIFHKAKLCAHATLPVDAPAMQHAIALEVIHLLERWSTVFALRH